MIEKDVLLHLQNQAALTALVSNKIYLIQAPQSGVTMPWLIVENTSGFRKQISQTKLEETAYLRLTVDCGPTQYTTGRDIIEVAKNSIENYRGLLNTANDAHITCGSVRGWAGLGGSYRYQVDVAIQFTEVYTVPS